MFILEEKQKNEKENSSISEKLLESRSIIISGNKSGLS